MKASMRFAGGAWALSLTITVLADGPPPTSVDFGAVKLKRANTPTTKETVAPATTSLPAVQRSSVLPAGTTTPAPAATPAPSTAQATTQQPADPGVGTVVQSPLRNRASNVLNQSSNNQTDKSAQSNSNDVQVKMPSMFRRN